MKKNTRYRKDITLELPTEIVQPILEKFIADNGMHRITWKEENCWTSDYGNIQNYYYFNYHYDKSTLHMEAWIGAGNQYETGLTGASSITSKVPYLQKIHQLSRCLIEQMPESLLRQRAVAELLEEEKLLKKGNKLLHICLAAAFILFVLSIIAKMIPWSF